MTEKENATISVATTDDGKETSLQGNNVSGIDNTTSKEKFNGNISRVLGHGIKNAIKKDKIMRLTGINDTRMFYDRVRDERLLGALILADKVSGYFLPAVDEDGNISEQGFNELKRFYEINRKTAISIMKSGQGTHRALQEYAMKNQISIEEFLNE